MRPGTTYMEGQAVKRSGPPTGTDPWFLVGITQKGVQWDDNQEVITSWDQFLDKTGGRITSGIAYDAVEGYFRMGGQRLYFSRVLGPSALRSSKILLDGASGQSLKVWASSPGSWGDSLRIAVTAGDAGGNYKLTLTHSTDTSINLISPDLVDTDAAVTWAANTSDVKKYISIDKLGSVDPAVAAASALTSGTDDIGSVTDAHWKAAGLAMPKDLGSGQFSMAGRTTAQCHADSLEVAALTNRKAILDLPDTTSWATLKAASLALRSNQYWRSGATFAGWGVGPGVTLGTTRDIPPSSGVAAKIAFNEVVGNENGPLTANDPAAGDNGILDWLLDVKKITGFTDAVQTDLNASGVNVIYRKAGIPKIYGWRSLADPSTIEGKKWLNFANVRLEMAIQASAMLDAEPYVLTMIDGNRHRLASFAGDLMATLKDDYLAHGAIFYNDDGTPGMWVDVLSPEVNPVAQLEAMTLKGKIGVKMSPMAEEVIVEFTKVGLTEVVA